MEYQESGVRRMVINKLKSVTAIGIAFHVSGCHSKQFWHNKLFSKDLTQSRITIHT